MTIVPLAELPEYVRNVRTVLKMNPTLERATVVALRGDLGAGKTTLTQAFANALGVAGVVQSPTYVLMKRYTTTNDRFSTLVHIDAYRFERPTEWQQLKPQEFLNDPAALVLVEWPERVEGFMPKPDLTIDIKQGGSDQERDIVMHA